MLDSKWSKSAPMGEKASLSKVKNEIVYLKDRNDLTRKSIKLERTTRICCYSYLDLGQGGTHDISTLKDAFGFMVL
jgi:hypothetical protein